ncbi:MAG: BatD family protein [Verrucomicrobiota bacterium]
MAGAATVTATLDPPQVALGESAQLTVTVSGSQEQPAVPKIDGLEIISVGQSTQIEIINGSITANASNTYSITPQHEGTFTIPAIHAGNAVSQPLTLRVGAGAPCACGAVRRHGSAAAIGTGAGGHAAEPARAGHRERPRRQVRDDPGHGAEDRILRR